MKKTIGVCCVLAFLAVLLRPLEARAAAETAYTALFPKTAAVGEEVCVPVMVKNNPGLTTLGLCLSYDSGVLRYKKAEWSQGLRDGKNRLTLVSDVAHADTKALNITMIDSTGYREDGACVLLYFEVLDSYEKSPVALQFRNASDLGEKPASGIAGTLAATDGEAAGKPDAGEGTETGSGRDVYDESFQTGVFECLPVCAAAAGLALTAAALCLIYVHQTERHGKREIRNLIRPE